MSSEDHIVICHVVDGGNNRHISWYTRDDVHYSIDRYCKLTGECLGTIEHVIGDGDYFSIVTDYMDTCPHIAYVVNVVSGKGWEDLC